MPKIKVLVLISVVVTVLLGTPATVLGQDAAKPSAPVFTTESLIAVGGAVGLAVFDTYEEPTTCLASYFLAQRFRLPRYTTIGLELNMTLPHTFGAGLLLEAVHTRHFRLHLPELGVVWYPGEPMSVSRIHREYDVYLGLGFDLRFWKGPRLAVEWRAFLPEPVGTITKMADFARPVYEEALKGGQLWIGVALPW